MKHVSMNKGIAILLVIMFFASTIKINAQDTLVASNVYSSQQCVEIAFKNNADLKLALVQLMNIPYSVNMKLKTIPEGVLAQPYDATVDYVIAKK